MVLGRHGTLESHGTGDPAFLLGWGFLNLNLDLDLKLSLRDLKLSLGTIELS